MPNTMALEVVQWEFWRLEKMRENKLKTIQHHDGIRNSRNLVSSIDDENHEKWNKTTFFSVSKMHCFSLMVISEKEIVELSWAELRIPFPQCKLNLEFYTWVTILSHLIFEPETSSHMNNNFVVLILLMSLICWWWMHAHL